MNACFKIIDHTENSTAHLFEPNACIFPGCVGELGVWRAGLCQAHASQANDVRKGRRTQMVPAKHAWQDWELAAEIDHLIDARDPRELAHTLGITSQHIRTKLARFGDDQILRRWDIAVGRTPAKSSGSDA